MFTFRSYDLEIKLMLFTLNNKLQLMLMFGRIEPVELITRFLGLHLLGEAH